MEKLRGTIAQLAPGIASYWALQLNRAEIDLDLFSQDAERRLTKLENELPLPVEPATGSSGPIQRLQDLLQEDLKRVLTVTQWEQLQQFGQLKGRQRAEFWARLLEQRRKLDDRLELAKYRSVWTGTGLVADTQRRVWGLMSSLLGYEREDPRRVRDWRHELARVLALPEEAMRNACLERLEEEVKLQRAQPSP